ncbi:MAG: tetratricopeptide repeat protein [Lentisphaerae bacterium]|jgi:hypothetical protein|nr:tetratricopeptide repeat protein [Lentisphaerota bacterium]MBT4817410.1 tetratricopeptide repeat protein [Lentisphaerota bacterium]MBT5609804.1 tetratricopeptide repeat protein [Lentisphaerota bacterium]MBT7055122.1 tetratricopeptide repeat protein [Lentisphaerota bacterium]MBT7846294.1 tetratricopeptide repeat protein [Lentisphaerota bacterium]
MCFCRAMICRRILWVGAVALLAGCRSVQLGEASRRRPSPAVTGSTKLLELRSPSLPLASARLVFDGNRVVVTSTADGVRTGWEWHCAQDDGKRVWRLTAERTPGGTAGTVEYLFLIEASELGPAALRPLLATARGVSDTDSADATVHQTTDVELVDSGSGATVRTDLTQTTAWCLEHLDELRDPELAAVLGEHLWHHQNEDSPPGSYNGIIALAYRQVELDPQVVRAYTDTAWLLWSKWVSWKQDPEGMPDGEDGVTRALALLRRGAEANPDSARYHYDAGMTLMPLARSHLPDLYPTVNRHLERAVDLSDDLRLRILAGRQLGHNFRLAGDVDSAERWYRRVLELDPDNIPAKDCLRRLLEAKGAKRP